MNFWTTSKGVTVPAKEQTQALAKYNKDERRAQRILIESIKDPLIPYVSKLETSKEIYDKMVELFSVSTVEEVILMCNELYKMKISKEVGIAPYFMKTSEMGDQLQELGEVMSNKEMTIVVLNALPEEWGNFTSSIYAKKEATPLMNFGLYAKLRRLDSKPKMMWDQRSRHLLLWPRENGNLVSLVHRERVKEICPKSNALAANSMDTIRGIFLSLRNPKII